MADGNDTIACAACGRKYAPGDDHPCLRRAAEAETERLEAAARGEPTGVRHVRMRGSRREGVIEATRAQGLSRHVYPAPGHLGYYYDNSERSDGTAGQHLCLCETCHARMRDELGCSLGVLGYIEGPELVSRVTMTDEGREDWRADVDGCDWCGHPPAGQQRTRTGPSEWFWLLYLDGTTCDEGPGKPASEETSA